MVAPRTLDYANGEVNVVPSCRSAKRIGHRSRNINRLIPVALERPPARRGATANDRAEGQLTRVGRDEGLGKEDEPRATRGGLIREARGLRDGRVTIEENRRRLNNRDAGARHSCMVGRSRHAENAAVLFGARQGSDGMDG